MTLPSPNDIIEDEQALRESYLQIRSAPSHIRLEVQAKTSPNAEIGSHSSHFKHKLGSLINRELHSIEMIWVPVGQFNQPPKRIRINVKLFCETIVLYGTRYEGYATRDIKFLFKFIRNAIRVIAKEHNSSNDSSQDIQYLANKARVFLKRLPHDADFNQNFQGAKYYRRYVDRSRRKKALFTQVCPAHNIDLGNDWQVSRITTARDLTLVGKSLKLCVNKINSESRSYFDALRKGDCSYWNISRATIPMGLMEVKETNRNRHVIPIEGLKEIGEFDGYDHEVPEIPQEIVRKLSTKLPLNPQSSDICIRAGVFTSFIVGKKDTKKPDFKITIEHFHYDVWVSRDEIILRKYVDRDYSDIVNDNRLGWAYFYVKEPSRRRSRRTPRLERGEPDSDRSPEALLQPSVWRDTLSEIGLGELVQVFTQYLFGHPIHGNPSNHALLS